MVRDMKSLTCWWCNVSGSVEVRPRHKIALAMGGQLILLVSMKGTNVAFSCVKQMPSRVKFLGLREKEMLHPEWQNKAF